MPKKRSPFIGYTPEQVFASEAVCYVVIAGVDLFDYKGTFVFDRKSAIRHFNKIRIEMLKVMQFGTKRQKKNAKLILDNLKVEPLRIH